MWDGPCFLVGFCKAHVWVFLGFSSFVDRKFRRYARRCRADGGGVIPQNPHKHSSVVNVSRDSPEFPFSYFVVAYFVVASLRVLVTSLGLLVS